MSATVAIHLWRIEHHPIREDEIHLFPNYDTKPHIFSVACSCRPTIEHTCGGVMVGHFAFDGREFYEKDAFLTIYDNDEPTGRNITSNCSATA